MNILITPTTYTLPKPETVGKHLISKRDTLLIEVFDSQGNVGVGETSPLPHLSTETTQDALCQLRDITPKIALLDTPTATELLNTGIQELWNLPPLLPSVAFGLECAILDYLSACTHTPRANLITPYPMSKVTHNALITPHTHNPITQLKEAKQKGIHCFKIKIGWQDPLFDIELIQEIALHLDDMDTLRIDPSRVWDIDTWVDASKQWEGIPIDYVEDPMTNPDDIHHFHDLTQLNIASDQWTLKYPLESLLYIPGLTTLIIKPTAFGGVSKIHHYHTLLKKTRLNLVISNCYESTIGQAHLIDLAKAYSKDTPVGLPLPDE